MILVIDAYNILKVISRDIYIDQQLRNQFLHQLGLYGTLKGHKIVAVFDGGPSDRTLKERVNGVYVVYSGSQESADDYIRSYVEKHKNEDIVVISSDGGVRRYVAQLGVEAFDALAFYRVVKQELKQNEKKTTSQLNTCTKTTLIEDPELDALMKEYSSSITPKHDETEKQRIRTAQQPSKIERALRKKIRKL